MKCTTALFALAFGVLLLAHDARAQGLATPLTIQGIEQFVDVGAKARAMGGAQIGSLLGAPGLFFDPAGLAHLDAPEARLGAFSRAASYEQRQEWLPNRFYVEMSLIMENDPVTVHRPFDDIKPEWSRRHTDARPGLVAGAVPFQIGGTRIVAGVGYATVIDLDHYFQNNNVLDPNIGRMRPAPVPRVTQGDSLQVSWFQHRRERGGFVSSITPALAVRIGSAFSFGASLSRLSGSSDDLEERADRGLFTLRYNNNLSLDPAEFQGGSTGSSTYIGTYATLSGGYSTGYLRLGMAVRTPFEFKREWTRTGSTVPGENASSTSDGTDVIQMPMTMSFGVTILPTHRWLFSATVDRRAFGDVTYRADESPELSPWLEGNAVRLGAEFKPVEWLSIRGGYRDIAETFAAEGAGLMDEPVRGTVLSTGLGFTYGRFGIDAALEYARTSYEDRWLSNVNYNDVTRTTFVFETFVRL